MDAAAELGRNPVSKHQIQLSMEMSMLTRDGTAEPVSRDQSLRNARGQGNIIFPCSADHEQDWQPYPVDPYSAMCDDHTHIHSPLLTSTVLSAEYLRPSMDAPVFQYAPVFPLLCYAVNTMRSIHHIFKTLGLPSGEGALTHH